jgi:hypothetical protein
VLCGALALFLLFAARLYLHSIGWSGRGWTGLMQRSLVLPALLFLGYLAQSLTRSRGSENIPLFEKWVT